MRSTVPGVVTILMVGLLAPVPVPAQQQEKPAARLPEARDVIERHIKAIGGREAVMAQSSRHVTGAVSMPSAGVSGSFEVFEAKPNKALMKMTIGGLGEMSEGFDGTIGWSINLVTGPTLLEGKQLEERKLDSDFFGDLQLEKRYKAMQTVDRVEFEGTPCYKVQLTRRDGGEDVQFFDVETGLRVGSIITRETPLGAMTTTIVEGDYKRFGKLLYPTRITNTAMSMQQLLTIARVEFDTVDPSVFEPPAVIKALVR